MVLKNLAGCTLAGDAIIQTNIFTREPGSAILSNPVACFSHLLSAHNHNAAGCMEHAGQRASMIITDDSTSSTSIHFDQKLGRLIDFKSAAQGLDALRDVVQGGSTTCRIDCETESSFQLVGP
jgi:hypothetical protein